MLRFFLRLFNELLGGTTFGTRLLDIRDTKELTPMLVASCMLCKHVASTRALQHHHCINVTQSCDFCKRMPVAWSTSRPCLGHIGAEGAEITKRMRKCCMMRAIALPLCSMRYG